VSPAPGERGRTPLVAVARTLRDEVSSLAFSPPVTHCYNPLGYAWDPHRRYLETYARPGVPTVLVGMNPGPFGMAQTGVPFGDATLVRSWLGIDEPVGKPPSEHPKRPVAGFACPRREVSGQRLWGWARDRFGSPERFFAHFMVLNYCPLCFLEESGRNRTPDRLPVAERGPLFAACDRALSASVEALAPRRVVGIGRFAEDRARAALDGLGVEVGRILHPSPASPQANRGWAEQAEAAFEELGVAL
jgi:single-strand selective monofunctional uracil DNA glycosylase